MQSQPLFIAWEDLKMYSDVWGYLKMFKLCPDQ